jgi:glyoxalase family protein
MPERPRLLGLHHVTAICGDPQPNIDFWVGLLGQRLVKRTVNFDDPGTWHLYYADAAGTPGSIMTFFPWPGAAAGPRARGRPGAGQIVTTLFAIPMASFDYWVDRIGGASVDFDASVERFGERRIALRDGDDIAVELVATDRLPRSTWWSDGPIPREHAIAGIHGVALLVNDAAASADVLTGVLGFRAAAAEGERSRFIIGDDAAPNVLELIEQPDAAPGRMGTGAVHHVAWRVSDRATEERWQRTLMDAGIGVTEVKDRQYFESIYFNEPGGVIFEIATDPPGFTRDESFETLGTTLKLPPWLEPRRAELEARLPEIGPPRAWRL